MDGEKPSKNDFIRCSKESWTNISWQRSCSVIDWLHKPEIARMYKIWTKIKITVRMN